jgi:hypothetical protein
VHHEPVPDEQYEQRPNGRTDEPRALVEPVPADGLAEEGGDERTADLPSRLVTMKPFGSLAPGDNIRATMPARNPITMIQMMFHTTVCLGCGDVIFLPA